MRRYNVNIGERERERRLAASAFDSNLIIESFETIIPTRRCSIIRTSFPLGRKRGSCEDGRNARRGQFYTRWRRVDAVYTVDRQRVNATWNACLKFLVVAGFFVNRRCRVSGIYESVGGTEEKSLKLRIWDTSYR